MAEMQISVHQSPDSRAFEVQIQGSATIENAQPLKSELLRVLTAEDSDTIVVNCIGAEAVDLTCLQILCAAHRLAIKTSKSFSLSGRSETFVRVAAQAGFVCCRGCCPEGHDSCLWNEPVAESVFQ